MKHQAPHHHPHNDLDQHLRDAAHDRQATLDRLAPAYPVSEYPPRPADQSTVTPSSGAWMRAGRLLGLGGATAAGLFGLVTLIGLVLTPEPNLLSPTAAQTPPAPETPIPSIYTLAEGLAQFESGMEQRLAPSMNLAAAWPNSIQALPEALLRAEQQLQQPMKDELTAVQADLQTAARYLRQRWVRPTPTGAGPSPDTSPAIS